MEGRSHPVLEVVVNILRVGGQSLSVYHVSDLRIRGISLFAEISRDGP